MKTKRYQNRSLLHCAKDQPCVLCGKNDGTTVPAHLPGAYYGMPAGTAQKVHDWCVGWVCFECHNYLDGPGRKDTETRMKALCLTLERLFEQGHLGYGKGKVIECPSSRT